MGNGMFKWRYLIPRYHQLLHSLVAGFGVQRGSNGVNDFIAKRGFPITLSFNFLA